MTKNNHSTCLGPESTGSAQPESWQVSLLQLDAAPDSILAAYRMESQAFKSLLKRDWVEETPFIQPARRTIDDEISKEIWQTCNTLLD